MKPIVDLPGQTFLFDLGETKRRAPTRDELEHAVLRGANIAISKWHRGIPPPGMDFNDLKQEVMARGIHRCRKFMHGAEKTLEEFAYMSCYWSLRDIQNENMNAPKEVQSYPLFENTH